MTTRVGVMNHGPAAVEVRTTQAELNRLPPAVVKPGAFQEFYVYNGQRLLIDEEKPDAADEG